MVDHKYFFNLHQVEDVLSIVAVVTGSEQDTK